MSVKTDKIIVVGGGSSGWMTAATLIRTFPNKDIYVIESKDVPIVGVGESTLGGIKRWTTYIGLDEKDFFEYTDASYKMSIKFTDFYKKNSGGFHYPFGKPLVLPSSEFGFNDWFMKKYFFPETPVEDFVRCYFPSASLFENNKFSLNNFNDYDSFNHISDVAYHFDAVKFGSWLREKYCIPRGVHHIQSTVIKVNTDESGVESLVLEDGSIVSADLYIDCTGFKSLLLSDALKEPFVSYSEMLPNNRAWATRLPYKDKEREIEPFTNSTAIENGWCWNIPLWSRLGTGYVYSDKFVSPEEALEQFKNYLKSSKMVIPRTEKEVEELEFRDIKMRVGIHKRTFVKNVVAIGLSAGFIEPLESNGLFSVHEFLFKLIDIIQRGDVLSRFDIEMYNSSVRNLFEGFASFVAMHYALSHRDDTEYWKSISEKSFNVPNHYDLEDHKLSKNSGFYDMAVRYLDNWNHPVSSGAGITYIATGMNFNMLNDARMQAFINNSPGFDYYGYTLSNISFWENNKAKWKRNSDNSPTLYNYLKDTFHNGVDSDV